MITISHLETSTYVYDIETYPNLFLVVFKKLSNTRNGQFEIFLEHDLDALKNFLLQKNLVLIGYNNFRFDDVVMKAILDGTVSTAQEICDLATRLIESNNDDVKITKLTHYGRKEWGYRTSPWGCIDLFQILGGPRIAGSLKSHEVRLGLKDVRDLPFKPGTVLTENQAAELTQYCEHDVNATEGLYFHIEAEVEVRVAVNAQYPNLKTSALRRSNAAIAEAVIKHKLETTAGLKLRDVRKPEAFTFNTASNIDPAIEFQTLHNQKLLMQLKNQPAFNVRDWKKNLNQGCIFHADNHRLALGKGGVHTIISYLNINSDNIVCFDVASYYPSLLLRINQYPAGLVMKWLDSLRGLRDERLAAKRAGNKVKADAFKIIINSLYGKLEEQHSINYDPALQLSVVLNGQLFLIMLMEAFQVAGFKIISANTDGVYIDVGDKLDEAQDVADVWMNKTGFSLDRDIATRIVATSVNDYALYQTEKGWYHKKGRFGHGKRTKPAVITEAVLNHISTGQDVAAFISSSTNILDFLYSSSVRGNNIEEIRHGKTAVQRTNRWYRSVNGLPIEKCAISPDGHKKWAKVPNSDSCTVANTLHSFEIPEDLDFNHYIGAAKKLLHEINTNKPPKEVVQSKLVSAAKKAQTKGLVIVPKGRPGNEKANIIATYNDETINYWLETPLEDAEWGNHQGFGAYTGQQFGLIGIDIDDPEKAKNSGLFDHIGKNPSVAWHGSISHEEVIKGECVGTLLFRYDGDELRTTNAQYFHANGYELLFGKKVVQLAGNHPNGDTYQYRGKPKKIPKKCLSFLAWSLSEEEVQEPSSQADESPDIVNPALLTYQSKANADQEYAALGGALRIVTSKWGIQLEGLCVGHKEHTNRQGDQNMRVFMRNDTPYLHCFHQSCWIVRKEWQTHILDQLAPKKEIIVKPENVLLNGEAEEIATALEDSSRYKLVIAPTGSGKTHAIVVHVAKQLATNEGGVKFAIICSSKDQMIQLAQRFTAVLDTDNINELGIDLIESTASIKIKGAKSRDAVRPVTRVAITHYTYISRRKFSLYYYAFLKFIDSNTHVFIDEVDAFIESQTTHYPLGSRKRRISRGGKIKNIHVGKCGMFHRSNNCTNCIMYKYNGNRLDVDEYRNLGYITVPEFMEGTQLEALEHIDIESRIQSKLRIGTSEIMMLKQTGDPGEIQFNNDESAADFKTTFDDHLDSAYLPTVHRSVITYDGEEITRDALIERFRLNQDMSTSDIPEDERKRLRFPSRACNVLTVTSIDRRPLAWMANARSLTALTATLSPSQQQTLLFMLENLKRFDIAPTDDRKMDKIIAIGMYRKIPLKMYQEGHLKFDKMFRYRETLRAAERDFEALRNGNVPIRMGYDRRKFMLSSDENDYGKHKILQTYAFSTLGRGVDFASYDLVSINSSIHKPISAYVTDDPESLKDQLQEERSNIIIQNIGRILRKTSDAQHSTKIVIIEQLESEEELPVLADVLSNMSHEPVEYWWVPNFISDVELCEHISQTVSDRTLPPNLPTDYRVLIDRAEQLISSGEGRTGIKKALRWQTVRKKLAPTQVREVEEAIDRLLEDRKTDTDKSISNKNLKLRSRRLHKLNQLISEGFTDGQIRSRMNVRSGKAPWSKSEQEWFEKQIKSVRS